MERKKGAKITERSSHGVVLLLLLLLLHCDDDGWDDEMDAWEKKEEADAEEASEYSTSLFSPRSTAWVGGRGRRR